MRQIVASTLMLSFLFGACTCFQLKDHLSDANREYAIIWERLNYAPGDPLVASISPNRGDTWVRPDSVVTIVFTNIMDQALTTPAIQLTAGNGDAVPNTVTWAGDQVATIRPNSPFVVDVTYRVDVITSAQDATGATLAKPAASQFSVRSEANDETAPVVVAVTPVSGNIGEDGVMLEVPVQSQLRVQFSETIVEESLVAAISLSEREGSEIPITLESVSPSSVRLIPGTSIQPEQGYRISISQDAVDLAGNALAVPYVHRFETSAQTEGVVPSVVSVLPSNRSENVARETAILLEFSTAMDFDSVSGSLLVEANGEPVLGQTTWLGQTLVFTPADILPEDATVTITVSTTALSAGGQALTAELQSYFVTGEGIDVSPPTVVSLLPENDATDVPRNPSVVVAFSEVVNTATLPPAISLQQSSTRVPLVVIGLNEGSWVLLPQSTLLRQTAYTLSIDTSIEDMAGNALAAPRNATWTTVSPPPGPSVTEFTIAGTPSPNALTGAPNHTIDPVLDVTLSAEPQPGTTIEFYLITESSAPPVAWDFSLNTAPTTWQVTAADGRKELYAWVLDADNQVSEPFSPQTIRLDRGAPILSGLALAGGEEYATSTTVSLDIDAFDAGTGLAEYQVSTDGMSFGAWLPWSADPTFDFPGEGSQTLHVRVRDFLAQESVVSVSDSVIVDTLPPADVTDLVIVPQPNGTSLQLSWVDPADVDLAGIRIVRRAAEDPTGPNDPAATEVCDPCVSPLLDANLQMDTPYHYAVYAYDNVPQLSPGVIDNSRTTSVGVFDSAIFDTSEFGQ